MFISMLIIRKDQMLVCTFLSLLLFDSNWKNNILLIRSPAYGLTLAAETKNGSVIVAESCSQPRADENDSTVITIPEELAKEAVYKLLDEIYKVKLYKLIRFLNNKSFTGRCSRFLWTGFDI